MTTEIHKNLPLMVAKILREMLKSQQFETLADLKDALSERCSRLKLKYDGYSIDRALELVASNKPLAAPSPLLNRVQMKSLAEVKHEDFTPAEAKRIYNALMVRFARENPAQNAESEAPADFPNLIAV